MKKWIITLLALACILFLAACGTGDVTDTTVLSRDDIPEGEAMSLMLLLDEANSMSVGEWHVPSDDITIDGALDEQGDPVDAALIPQPDDSLNGCRFLFKTEGDDKEIKFFYSYHARTGDETVAFILPASLPMMVVLKAEFGGLEGFCRILREGGEFYATVLDRINIDPLENLYASLSLRVASQSCSDSEKIDITSPGVSPHTIQSYVGSVTDYYNGGVAVEIYGNMGDKASEALTEAYGTFTDVFGRFGVKSLYVPSIIIKDAARVEKDGNVTRYYGSDGVLRAESVCDREGREVKYTGYGPYGEEVFSYIREYDEAGRIRKYVGDGACTVNEVWEYYDDGTLRSHTSYNTDGEITYLEAYDESGRILHFIDATMNPYHQVIGRASTEIIYEYDEHGRLIKRIFSGWFNEDSYYIGEFETIEFDGNGNLLTYENGTSVETYEYDELGRAIKYISSSDMYSTVKTTNYNDDGRIAEEVKSSMSYVGETPNVSRSRTVYEYGDGGVLLRKVVYNADTDEMNFETRYDSAGRVTWYAYYSGGKVGFYYEYQYDENGNLLKYDNLGLELETYEYDEAGREVLYKYYQIGNLVKTVIKIYDDNGHLIRQETVEKDVITAESWGYDELGHNIAYTRYVDGALVKAMVTEYDANGHKLRDLTAWADGKLASITFYHENGRYIFSEHVGENGNLKSTALYLFDDADGNLYGYTGPIAKTIGY